MRSLPPVERPSTAIDRLPAGAVVVSGPGCGTPTTLLGALGDQALEEQGWQLWSALLLGPLGFVDAVRDGRLRYRTWHVVGATRELVERGLADFVPLRGSDVPAALVAQPIDAALVRTTPPDNGGYLSLGTSVSYTRAAVEAARVVIAEVDEDMPRTAGHSLLHISQVSALVASQHATPEYPQRPTSELARRISEHVMGLIPRDPVMQMGIGEVPEAMTPVLGEADLGHLRVVGLGTDGLVPLFDKGVLSPADLVPHPAVRAVELMGTRNLLDYADNHPGIGVYPVDVAGNPQALAEIDHLVSLNTALQVDLFGQVNAEFIAGRQIAGVGGAVDFIEAARRSRGGVRIVVLPAVAGDASRIVPRLEGGAPVSIPRHSIDHVVTEHGVASLAGLSMRERREALIGIAAPEHRGRLADDRPRTMPRDTRGG